MGISVRVVVDPKWISRHAWRRVYAETVTILQAWPDPPMRSVYKDIAGVKVIARIRDVIEADGWSVCGDARSRRFAESNELPSEFGVEQPSEPDSEIILRDLEGDRSVDYLLGNKTQGLAFHFLIVAVAMLIEHRFPRAAVVSGDLDLDDALLAQEHLERILGERIPRPVFVDPKRMRARLQPHLEGAALDDALQPTVRASEPTFGMSAGAFGPPSSRDELQKAVTCTDVTRLTVATYRIIEQFAIEVEATARAAGLSARLSSCSDAEPLIREIAKGARKTGVYATVMAWDEILRASLDELRFLAALAWMRPMNYGVELRPAAFESAAIRQLCVETIARGAASVEALDLRDWSRRRFVDVP